MAGRNFGESTGTHFYVIVGCGLLIATALPASADPPLGLTYDLTDCQPENDAGSGRDASWDEPVEVGVGSFRGCIPTPVVEQGDFDDRLDVYLFSGLGTNLVLGFRPDVCDSWMYETSGFSQIYANGYYLWVWSVDPAGNKEVGFSESFGCSGPTCWWGSELSCTPSLPTDPGTVYALEVRKTDYTGIGDFLVDSLIVVDEPVDGDYSFSMAFEEAGPSACGAQNDAGSGKDAKSYAPVAVEPGTIDGCVASPFDRVDYFEITVAPGDLLAVQASPCPAMSIGLRNEEDLSFGGSGTSCSSTIQAGNATKITISVVGEGPYTVSIVRDPALPRTCSGQEDGAAGVDATYTAPVLVEAGRVAGCLDAYDSSDGFRLSKAASLIQVTFTMSAPSARFYVCSYGDEVLVATGCHYSDDTTRRFLGITHNDGEARIIVLRISGEGGYELKIDSCGASADLPELASSCSVEAQVEPSA